VIEFTPEQWEAIGRRDGSLLLHANAGSGKTSVLVERFVRMVLDDEIEPARILAITFTDKAAGELRERVRSRFVELAERTAARETEAAWVSTIHGFCARLLRTHALTAGLDPAFSVLDESQARELRGEALDDALRGFLADGGADALDLLAAYTIPGGDRLGEAVRRVHDVLRSRGRAPVLPPVAERAYPAAERAALAEAADRASAEIRWADGKKVEDARAQLARCGEVLAALEPEALPTPRQLEQMELKSGNTGALCGPACEAYREAWAAFTAACLDYRATRAWPLIAELLERYAAAYADVKAARGALDFDDLEIGVRDLLRSEPALRAATAARFERIMVDEFQDTNPLQLEILEALERDNLFVVGDEFQSIYGFRHADVEVFRRRRAQLEHTGAVAALAGNFRSDPAILDALNVAFAPLFGRGFVLLEPGDQTGGSNEPVGAEPRVELLVTDSKGWDDGDLGSTLPPEPAWRRAEARMLAQRVRDLVDSGDAAAGEIVVLVRASGSLAVFERALIDQGLTTLSAGGRGYWSRQQVQDLLAWLTALANPRDTLALGHVLASPLVGASSDALALVWLAAQAAGRGPWETLTSAVRPADEDERAAGAELAAALSAGDRERLAAFAELFAAERAAAPRLGLQELIARVVTATGYDIHVLSLPGGPRRMANVHKLGRLADAYERAHGHDLRAFVDYATAEEEAEAREPDAPVEAGDLDAVRLMTIHAAKGLEFDVVCVADLGRRPGNGFPDLLVSGEQGGLRVLTLEPGSGKPALDFDELKTRAQLAADDEEKRVMYVAMTRAKRRLLLSGAIDAANWPEPSPTAVPLTWIAPAFVPSVAARLTEPGGPAAQDVVTQADGRRCVVRLVRNAPDTVGDVLRPGSLAPDAERAAVPGAATRSAGEQLALAVVPEPPQPAPPARPAGALSYSALASYDACGYRFYLERVLRLPPVDDDAAVIGRVAEAGLDARLRGTLAHELLERLDFARPAVPGDEDMLALAATHGVTLGPEDPTDLRALVAGFAASPLCARLAAATNVRREHGFAFALDPAGADDLLITGFVDVRGREGDAALVVDYKSDRLAPDADLAATVERAYGAQRRIYALAELRAGAAAVEVVHVYLERAGEPVGVRYEAADVSRLEAELAELAAGIAAGRFEVTSEPHRSLCQTCPGRRALCSYPEELTLRELDAPARAPH
jgi:ATP-dependent exoDNAse (exonuclease V) beta subunit